MREFYILHKRHCCPSILGKSVWLFAICLAALVGCEKKEKKKTVEYVEVGIAPVVKKTIPINVDFSGTIESIKSVQIIPRVSGYIDKRYYTEGTFVKAGDPLYLIDPKPFKAALDAAAARLQVDQTQYDFWAVEANRYTNLSKSGAVSIEKMQEMVARKNAAMALVERDQADVEKAKLNLGYTAINAPFSGRVQRTLKYVGDLVQEQRDQLTSVIQMSPIYVLFNVSRSHSYDMQVLASQKKLFDLDKMIVKIFLPNGAIYEKVGKIDYVSFQIDPSTDCQLARGIIENPISSGGSFRLVPGQYAPVRVTIGEEPDALLVPEIAIVQSQVGTTVCVVGKDNRVSIRPVELGRSYETLRQITKGIEEGERVVAHGVQKVKDGTLVKEMDVKHKTTAGE